MSLKTIGKGNLITQIAEATGSTKAKTSQHLELLIDIVGRNLARGNKVTITGFGTFTSRKRPARKGRNPSTGESIKIKASTVPVFKAGATLKTVVGKK